MSGLRNGGPAFPGITVNDTDVNLTDPFGTLLSPNGQAAYSGMSLRDAFAMKAMHAEIVTCGVPGEAADAMLNAMDPNDTVEEHIAKNAYRMADAMLKERAK